MYTQIVPCNWRTKGMSEEEKALFYASETLTDARVYRTECYECLESERRSGRPESAIMRAQALVYSAIELEERALRDFELAKQRVAAMREQTRLEAEAAVARERLAQMEAAEAARPAHESRRRRRRREGQERQ